MRLLIQRVLNASVDIDSTVQRSIQRGLLIFVGFTHGDTQEDVQKLAHKVQGLRVFEDDCGKMNLSLAEVQGELMVISQFTLYGSARKGFRPSFTGAMDPLKANELYECFIEILRAMNLKVQTGSFGSDMKVSLINDGPVTLLLESLDGQIQD